MSEADRRKVLRLAVLAALAPSMLARSPAAANAAGLTAGGLIAPPPGPMHYRRTVEHELAGGGRIVVARSWRVSFNQNQAGFTIDGDHIAVETDFPPGLERFAKLEAARPPEAIFPLALDPFGQIAESAATARSDGSIRQAVAEALSLIGQQTIAADQRQGLQGFVETLHQAGSMVIAQLPADLFAPARTEWSERQDVSLPTGEQGRVTSRFAAVRDTRTGLMREAVREIRTELDGDQRQTRESWLLEPI